MGSQAPADQEPAECKFGYYPKEARELAVTKYKLCPEIMPLNHATIPVLTAVDDKEKQLHMLKSFRENWLFDYKSFGVKAFGAFIYPNSQTLEMDHDKPPLEPSCMKNRLIPQNKPEFKIIQRFSRRTYKAVHIATGKFQWCKINHEENTRFFVDFHYFKEWYAMIVHCEYMTYHRTHMLDFSGYFYHPRLNCRFFFRPLMDTVADLVKRCKGLGKVSAFYLATETFEAIHDCHIHGITHRDIRPSNFLVGRGAKCKAVYIIGFTVSHFPREFQLKRNVLMLNAEIQSRQIKFKSRHFDWRFTPRVYHTVGDFYPIDDIESWLYMVLHLFNRDLLPWNMFWPNCWDLVPGPTVQGIEVAILNVKNRFMTGFHDAMFPEPLRDFVRVMRGFIEMNFTKSNNGFLDYGFIGFQLEKIYYTLKCTTPADHLDWVGVDDNTPNKPVDAKKRSESYPCFKKETLHSEDRKGLAAKPPSESKSLRNFIMNLRMPPVSTEEVKIEKTINNLDDDEVAEAEAEAATATQCKEGPTQEGSGANEDLDDPAAGVALPSFSTKKEEGSKGSKE